MSQRPRTRSERKVAALLRNQLGPDDVLLEGVRFTDSLRGDVEADILLFVAGAGVAVIEVKGGQVTFEAGEWRTRLRGGSRRIQPIEQARAAKHAFRQYIGRQSPRGTPLPRAQWFVAMPLTDVTGDMGPEGLREQLIGRNDLPNVSMIVRKSLAQVPDSSPPPDASDIDRMLKLLANANVSTSAHNTSTALVLPMSALASLGAAVVSSALVGYLTTTLTSGWTSIALIAGVSAGIGALTAGSHRFSILHPSQRVRRTLGACASVAIAMAGVGVNGGATANVTVAQPCQVGYSPCLPIKNDLDCKDVVGSVKVTGPDIYRLDADGDGIGCEWNEK